MSESAQTKRKFVQKNKLDSDSESENMRPKKTPKLNQKRKTLYLSSDDEDTGIFCLVQFLDAVERFDVVEQKNIHFESGDMSSGKVKHLGKFFKVKILKTGSKDYIEKKAERYSYCLSLNTCDETETNKELQTSKSKSHNDKSLPINNVKSIILDESNSTSPVYQVPRSQTISLEEFNEFVKKTDERDHKQKQYLEKLEKKLEDISNIKEKKNFIFNGVDLICDVDGYPIHVWAANCLEVLFTPEETKNCVLVKSKNSVRESCCPIKVKLLKEAMIFKYNLPPEKQDKVWRKIIDAFNTKGRGIKFNLKKAANALISRIGLVSNENDI
ncbi:unnamed protein product [Brachionus calyciflorus]|uniref:BEN domain-containing protein n=1 Tax=Brachionus calyciflorus TaxID=104777 RepID=A0A814K620_9BILA|nr:unnamed protein product [Brachionus calyciflorus]